MPGAARQGCLDDDAVLAFVEGRLPERACLELHKHMAECSACRKLVADTAGLYSRRLPGAEPSQLETLRQEEYSAGPDRGFDVAASPPVPLRRGDAVGRYVILEVVGIGGMGVVYATHDPQLDRKVALKLLRSDKVCDGARSADLQARLLREAKALARVSHPNVVAVHDVGTYREQVFLAMEFVEGQTLSRWLGAAQRSWTEIVSVMLQAGRGLAAAHATGLVHRDFKPQNILIGSDGRVRVTDFGLARPSLAASDENLVGPATHGLQEETAETLTRTGLLVGTPAYMSPEQFAGETATPSSDQFSFCVTLYEALYGERPFQADSAEGLALLVASGAVREPPVDAVSRVPAWLREILLRGLDPDPARRFSSMQALLDELDAGRMAARAARRKLSSSRRAFVTMVALAVSLCVAGAAGLYLHFRARVESRSAFEIAPSARKTAPRPALASPRPQAQPQSSSASRTVEGAPLVVAPVAPVAHRRLHSRRKAGHSRGHGRTAVPAKDDSALKAFDE